MNSFSPFLNYNGLYGDNNVHIPDFINSEALSTRMETYDWKVKEHLHSNLFQFFYLHKGYGEMISETQIFQLQSPCLITIPSNTLHGFTFHPTTRGRVITISDSYVDTLLKNHQNILRLIQRLSVYGLKEEKNAEEMHLMINKITLGIEESHQLGLQPWMQLLLIAIYRLHQSIKNDNSYSGNPYLKIFNEYNKLIRSSITHSKSVAEYAGDLGITTVHLNRVCKEVVSKSALKVIHEKLIEESKKFLLNTDYRVSEISYRLNFNDPAHFTKLFKKYVGASPSEFRKN